MWREYEEKLHMKLISIGKSLAEDDMIDSDTTVSCSEEFQGISFFYNYETQKLAKVFT